MNELNKCNIQRTINQSLTLTYKNNPTIHTTGAGTSQGYPLTFTSVRRNKIRESDLILELYSLTRSTTTIPLDLLWFLYGVTNSHFIIKCESLLGI